MTQATGWGAALAEGINGYIRGMQIKRGMDAQDADAEYQTEQRDRQKKQWAKDDALQSSLTDAAAPVTVTAGANGYTKPDSADNSDVGQPDGPSVAGGGLIQGVTVGGKAYSDPKLADIAATAANAPDAIAQRQAAAYSAAGQPLVAAQLKASITQGKLGELQLSKAQSDYVNEKFDSKLKSVTNPDQLAATLSGSPVVNGKEVKSVPTADGKSFQLNIVGDDGTLTPYGAPIENNSQGIQKALIDSSQSMSLTGKITALQHFNQMEQQNQQFAQNMQMHRETLAESSRHNRAQEGNEGARLSIAQQELGIKKDALKNDPFYNVPGGVKMQVNSLAEGIKSLDATINKATAEGNANPQGIQQLQAQRAALQGKLNDVLSPFLPKSSGSSGSFDQAFPPKGGKGTVAAGGIGAAPAGTAYRQLNGSWGTTAPQAPQAAAQGLPQATSGQTQSVAGSAPGAQSPQPSGQGGDPVLRALNPSGNPSLESIAAPKAAAIRQAGEAVRAAQAQVVQAAQSGNQQATQQATQAAAAAGEQLKQLVGDMNPQQAQQVIQALGI